MVAVPVAIQPPEPKIFTFLIITTVFGVPVIETGEKNNVVP